MPNPAALLPGSFNPLHAGHLSLAAAAGRILGTTVEYELSIVNVDKPELDEREVARRRQQFEGIAPLWVTRAPTFAEKALHFPGTVFVIGYDTAVRLIDYRYYGHDTDRLMASLQSIHRQACRFVVGGRIDSHKVFREWTSEGVPTEFHSLFTPLVEADFRVDLSSTELRRNAS